MSSELGFSLKVIVFFALTFGATLWFLNGAPVPVRTAKPMEPNAEIPTFADVAKNLNEQPPAQPQSEAEWQLEDALMQLVIGTVAYRFQKCDTKPRYAVAEAIGTYYRLLRENPGLKVTPRTLDLPQGKSVLDEKKVEFLIQELFAKGKLTLDEFSYQTRSALEGLVTPASEEKQRYYKDCQGLD